MENNKLIAEFMGEFNVHDTNGHWECSNCGETWSAMMGDNEVPMIHTDCKPDIIELAEYHTSWEWLMPVVEKIEREGYCFIDSRNEDGHWCQIGYRPQVMINPTVHVNNLSSKREATYKAVVEFIKLYNENK